MSLAILNQYDARAVAIVKDQLAPEATDGELAYFFEMARNSHLRPGSQIVLIGRWDSRARRKVHRPQVTVEGRRAIAFRSGQCEGIEGPWWCGPRTEDNGFQLVWDEVWAPEADEDGNEPPPYCARVFVYRAGFKVPANGTAKWSEFKQTFKTDQGSWELVPLWKQMPSHMLAKVAESLALRRAFPEEIDAVTEAWGGDDEEAAAVAEAEATASAPLADPDTGELPPPQPVPAPVTGAPGPRRPVEQPSRASSRPARGRRDEVPLEVYDNLPEAQGNPDPGRPFE
jgi:hypothetical protein